MHCHSPGVATVGRRIDVHNNNDDYDDNNDNDNA